MKHWDVIVLGLGGVGSSACWHLARSGLSVLGIDQHPAGHHFGSSHGQTRIVRQAYFEGVSYVPLLKRSYEIWDELNQHVSEELFVRCGLLQIGPSDGVVVPGVLSSAETHALPVVTYGSEELKRLWPGICCASDDVGIFESNAGFVHVERAVVTQLELAKSEGAELVHGVRVVGWEDGSDGVSIFLDDEKHNARQLVLALGPWSSSWLDGLLGFKIRVLRKYLYWFESLPGRMQLTAGTPCFFHETPRGYFYGFPEIDSLGVKIAMHSGGELVEQPEKSDREGVQRGEDFEECLRYAGSYLPGLKRRLQRQEVCYYSMTPDESFIFGRLKEHSRVIVAAGLSGHGFKFTPVLGELIARMANYQELNFDLAPFSPSRLIASE